MREPKFSVNTVLYTHDMEPITIIQLSQRSIDYLHQNGMVRLMVHQPNTFSRMAGDPFVDLDVQIVTITMDVIRKGYQMYPILLTCDEESALLLQSAFLPGQQRARATDYASGVAQGFLLALEKLGGVQWQQRQ